jgi:hypothetical protein
MVWMCFHGDTIGGMCYVVSSLATLESHPSCILAGVLIANIANKAQSIHNFAIALHLNFHLTSTQSS